MVIRFVIANAYLVGGTIRTTFVTAGELARRHEVEVVSVLRTQDEPALDLDPRVRLRALVDARPAAMTRSAAWLAGRPSQLVLRDDFRYRDFSLLSDLALLRFLRSVRDGVLLGTRPGLNIAIARHARAPVVRVAQEHLHLGVYNRRFKDAISKAYGRLDAVTALTEQTAQDYRDLLGPAARVECIPNAVSFVDPPRSDLDARVVLAAGKLSRRKGFDRLLLAWEQVVGRHPEWKLEIFGSGRLQPDIEAQIADLKLSGSVGLRGYTRQMPAELARASVLAMTSRNEGFPMLLLEAMAAGVPVVVYDCPTGPRDIVTQGVDGHLVPNGRTRLFADALSSLMDDAERRRRMGAAALEKVSEYEVAAIGARWEALLDELAAARSAGATSRGRGAATARARG